MLLQRFSLLRLDEATRNRRRSTSWLWMTFSIRQQPSVCWVTPKLSPQPHLAASPQPVKTQPSPASRGRWLLWMTSEINQTLTTRLLYCPRGTFSRVKKKKKKSRNLRPVNECSRVRTHRLFETALFLIPTTCSEWGQQQPGSQGNVRFPPDLFSNRGSMLP